MKTPIEEDATIAIITQDDQEALEILRHSTAHLTAQAIKRLFPDVKLGIGPVIEGGFYYDIDAPTPITAEDHQSLKRNEKSSLKT